MAGAVAGMLAGSIEIRMLFWALVLGLAQLLIATTLATWDQGLPYNTSARDLPPPPVRPLTARLLRAFHNFKETFVFFAVAVILVLAQHKANANSALGAQIYFWARLVYVPVYAAGIPLIRTVIWVISIVGLVMVITALA